LFAIQNNKRLLVYRAQEVSEPRPESQALIGSYVEPKHCLEGLIDFKQAIDFSAEFAKPNS
jgi:hypothetical protein